MTFSISFYFHFILSLAGFVMIGIYLCRGSWRNVLRAPWALGLALISIGHLSGSQGTAWSISFGITAVFLGLFYLRRISQKTYVPSEVRDGHNIFSILAGAALFALIVQLHAVLFGVPVFQITR